MKLSFLITILALFSFTNCKSKDQSGTNNSDPIIEASPGSESSLFSKGGRGDMVNELYNELVNKSEQLKSLDSRINNINQQIEDSTKAFKDFNANNERYYSSASGRLRIIKDSIIRQQILDLIKTSQLAYGDQIKTHKDLLYNVDSNSISIQDLHELLKVMITIPIIHDYQKRNLPSAIPIQKINQELERLKKSVDSSIQKNK